METVWTFKTRNFSVTLECEEENLPDLSWADEETLAKLDSGEWMNLQFKVAVHDASGAEIGSAYLGNSIHADPLEFIDHRACGRQTRELRAKRIHAVVGSYFKDMVSEAISEARKAYNTPRASLRKVA